MRDVNDEKKGITHGQAAGEFEGGRLTGVQQEGRRRPQAPAA